MNGENILTFYLLQVYLPILLIDRSDEIILSTRGGGGGEGVRGECIGERKTYFF